MVKAKVAFLKSEHVREAGCFNAARWSLFVWPLLTAPLTRPAALRFHYNITQSHPSVPSFKQHLSNYACYFTFNNFQYCSVITTIILNVTIFCHNLTALVR